MRVVDLEMQRAARCQERKLMAVDPQQTGELNKLLLGTCGSAGPCAVTPGIKVSELLCCALWLQRPVSTAGRLVLLIFSGYL